MTPWLSHIRNEKAAPALVPGPEIKIEPARYRLGLLERASEKPKRT
jgi:hypothetical protein